jgi:nitrite reductase/ring-hydroxylating ferredoxin subunit
MESIDRLAFIGPSPNEDENVYIVTGESGVGMTHGTIASQILTDAIFGRTSDRADLYDPRRRRLRAVSNYLKENLNVAAQYADWLTGGDVASVDEIAPGEGAIVRRGVHKVACYRDELGALHERSAVCPHLGCIVRWNPNERTWDCPCHGSRFDGRGGVISGPSSRDLAAWSEHEAAASRKHGEGER